MTPPLPPHFCPHCQVHYSRTVSPVAACPTCEMTPGEHAYRARILADSTAVYAEEAEAYRRQRLAG